MLLILGLFDRDDIFGSHRSVKVGCNLSGLPLTERRSSLKSLKLDSARIRIAEQFEASATDMLAAVQQQQLEGVNGKRKDSLYEPGKRSGSWVKYRVNRGQELVIGGYIPGPHGFGSLIIGCYQGKDLMYVPPRLRNGFVPASRRHGFEKIRHLNLDHDVTHTRGLN